MKKDDIEKKELNITTEEKRSDEMDKPTKKAVAKPKKTVQKKPNTAETLTDAQTSEVIENVTDDVITSAYDSAEIQNYQKLCKEISQEINSVEKSYLSIAIKIHTIHKKKLYQIGNFANIYDFAYEKFGLSRATCNNYDNICKKFGKFDNVTDECIGLLPEYEVFSPSQLVAMFSLPKAVLKDIKPEMSVREIRRLQKTYEQQIESNSECIAQTSESKSRKPQKMELLKVSDINEVLETQTPALLNKFEEFKQAHPDSKYSISVTLVYEG